MKDIRTGVIKTLLLLSTSLVLLSFFIIIPGEAAEWNEGTVAIEPDAIDPLFNGFPKHIESPGSTSYFTLYFHNSHTLEQTLMITIADGPDGWPASISSLLTIEPGASNTSVLAVTIPDEILDTAINYPFRVEAVAMESGDRAYILAIIGLEAEVDHQLTFTDTGERLETVNVYPGQQLYVEITLRNVGEMNDLYSIEIDDHNIGWDIQFREGGQEVDIDLKDGDFGSTFDTLVLIKVPDTTSPGGRFTIQVHSTSTANELYGIGTPNDQISMTFEIVKGSSISLDPQTTYVEVSEDHTTDIMFNAIHSGVRGTSFDPLINILLDGTAQPGWAVVIDGDGMGEIDVGEIRAFQAHITPPEGISGTFTVQYGGISDGADVYWASSTLKVIPSHEVDILSISGGPFNRTDPISIMVQVKNYKDEAIAVVLQMEGAPEDLMVQLEPSAINMGPKTTGTVTIHFEPLDRADLETFVVDVKLLIPLESEVEGWTTVSNMSHSVDFLDRPNLKIKDISMPSRQLYEEEEVVINVTVENTGYLIASNVSISLYELTWGLSRPLISSTYVDIPPGGTVDLTFKWQASPAAKSVVAVVDPRELLDEDDEGDNEMLYPVSITKRPITDGDPGQQDGGSVSPGVMVISVAGAVTLTAAALALVSSDAFRYSFFSAAFPLYSKLRPQKLLGNKLRRRIYVYIQNHPGEHFRAILVNLALTNGTLAHHLYTLEREKLIRSERDGLYRRFYPAGYRIENERRDITLVQRRILDKVEEKPGTSQKVIADDLKLSSSTVNYNIKALKDKGLIDMVKVGKSTSITSIEDKK
ncbi:MAG: winged helix-turn-helix transcriptional regulator [Thermoplasmata archaeon]|nr:winged helix-turn-helix transcriptional regulator [Thermoplasmata archaeon]